MIQAKTIREINKGNEKAFRDLYNLYFHKVVNYANKILHSKEDASEVAQDVFIKLWDKRNELNANQSIDGLIFRITKCTSIDFLRKNANSLNTVEFSYPFDQGFVLENQIMDKELNEFYLGIINKLPERRKYIFQLSRDKDLSHKKIATQLNISHKTVEAQIRLALSQIKRDLKRYSHDLIILFIAFMS